MSEVRRTVRVTADASGNVIIQSKNNPDWGHIRVEQVKMVVDHQGFARKKTVSALVSGTIEDLKGFGWRADEMVEGNVIFREQLIPFNKQDPERDYKIAGKTGIVCCVEGQPIYRKTFYNPDPDSRDTFLKDEFGNLLVHDNGEAIKAAYLELKENEEHAENANLSR